MIISAQRIYKYSRNKNETHFVFLKDTVYL